MPEDLNGARFSNKAPGFKSPNQSPDSEDLARAWQAANKAWWDRCPMRYDWRDAIPFAPGTKEYFEHIDRQFLEAVRHYLPWHFLPFEQLIPYDDLHNLDVLEIGVGHGTHAQLIAPHCKSFVGIDLTETATKATDNRLRLAGIRGRILPMDAEHMSFVDHSFDFIWSWGVIHHSSNTQRVLREMARVLRPGGKAIVMVYYRSPIQYYLFAGLGRGLLKGEFWSLGGIHRINQAATDGALARFFSIPEFSDLAQDMFAIDNTFITGQKADALPIPHGRLKSFLLTHTPDSITRFVTNVLRLGTFLIARLTRT